MTILLNVLIRISLTVVSVYFYRRVLGICRSFWHTLVSLGGVLALFQLLYVFLPGTDLFSSVSEFPLALLITAAEAGASVYLLWRLSSGRLAESFLFFSLHLLVNVASSLLLFLLSSLFRGEGFASLVATQWNDVFSRFIAAILQMALLLALSEAVARRRNSETPELRIGQFVPVFGAEAASLVILIVLMRESALYSRMFPALAILLLLYVAADATLLNAVRAFTKNRDLLQEVHALQKMQTAQKAYYLSLNEEMRRASRMRHDYKNMLQTLNILLASNETEKAQKFALSCGELIGADAVSAYTGNEILDAVLNNKAQSAKRGKIRFSVSLLLPDPFEIRDVDVMSIFANLLDNAFEYVSKLPEEKRAVDVSGEVRAGLWKLTFSNTFEGERVPDFSTTKADAAQHGYGVGIVDSIAKQYGGRLAASVEGGRLFITVLLNNAQKESTE